VFSALVDLGISLTSWTRADAVAWSRYAHLIEGQWSGAMRVYLLVQRINSLVGYGPDYDPARYDVLNRQTGVAKSVLCLLLVFVSYSRRHSTPTTPHYVSSMH
jgi:hypothetical protein